MLRLLVNPAATVQSVRSLTAGRRPRPGTYQAMMNPSPLAHDVTSSGAAPAARDTSDAFTIGNPPQGEVLNLPVLLSRCLGDRDFCAHLLGRFADRVTEQLTALDNAATSNAYDLAARAHALKGVAGNLSAELLESAAAELERRVRAGDVASAAPLLDRIRAEVVRAIEAVPAALDRLHRGG
jgi:HPt (histidine-containing phosphotransfer) domain-containing protein